MGWVLLLLLVLLKFVVMVFVDVLDSVNLTLSEVDFGFQCR